MTDFILRESFLKARRKVIEAQFKNLNDMQKEAALKTEGPLLILAGAGSGKTTVLINRIANLLQFGTAYESEEIPPGAGEEDTAAMEWYLQNPGEGDSRALEIAAFNPVEPWRIIALTFTNKAANELKERLVSRLGPCGDEILAATFHSACVRFLRRDIDRLGYKKDFTIYDTADTMSLMKKIISELQYDENYFQPRAMLSQISRAKDSMVSSGDFAAAAEGTGDIRKIAAAKIYNEYSKRLFEANALDFDDLLLLTVRLLLEYKDIREHYQNRFKYVLVDEYQDTNNLQYIFSSTLSGKWKNICVVGDDDQSIYKFRGATIENILNFEKQYKNTRVLRLEQNYRSSGSILDAANAVIRNNEGRKGKELWTEKPPGEKVSLYTAANERDEAVYLASRILEGFSAGANWQDYAVLYRMNAQSNQIEFELKRNAIPYKIYGGIRFFDRAEVKDVLAYLCLINNQSDDLRLLRIINTPVRGIGRKAVEAAVSIAREEGLPVYEVIRNTPKYLELQKFAPKFMQFVEVIEELKRDLSSLRLDKFYEEVLNKTGYISALLKADTVESRTKAENIEELKTNIIGYMATSEDESLAGFLDEIALYTDLEQYEQTDSSVSLMTMHSAKGLEFNTVFIVGAEEGIFPGSRAIGERDEMEEERRLCYVAMTRAREKLYITSARQRMLFGKTTSGIPSRFVSEIPDEYVEKTASKTVYSYESGVGFEGQLRDKAEKNPVHGGAKARPLPVSEVKKLNLLPGDVISHKAFGRGMIISVTPMGGDALIEIAFDSTGTKRLMLKSASSHMKKE